MNLYQLRYFTTLAQEEHYTKAALKLHITQPSLTHAIHLLEDELDVVLFEKKGRNVVLTKYGKLFLKEIEPILNRLDGLQYRLFKHFRSDGLHACHTGDNRSTN